MPSRDGHGQCCMVANKLKRSQSSQFSPLRDGGDVAKLQGKVTTVTGTLGADGKHKGLYWGGVCEESQSWWPGWLS